MLSIKNLKVSTDKKIILQDVTLNIKPGEVHVIMGPNGSGKSTLALALMGHPKYKFQSGEIKFEKKDLDSLSVDQRANLGIFLSFQNPTEIDGVTLRDFLYQIYISKNPNTSIADFENLLQEKIKRLKIKDDLIDRSINFKLSGGEKKLSEILQLSILQPKLAILDEIDSGLDIDALKNVCEAIVNEKSSNPNLSFFIITHHKRILNHIEPNFVHVMKHGKIVKSGGINLVHKIEKEGYSKI